MNREVFREYDVRGVVDTDLDFSFVYDLGRSVGTYARERGVKTMTVGRDCRLSSDTYGRAMGQGLTSAGIDVLDVGLCATPMLYFSIRHLHADGGVMVTGSHNPPEFNGFKICIGPDTIYGQQIQTLREIMEGGRYHTGSGKFSRTDISRSYEDTLFHNVTIGKGLHIAVDGGNGVGGLFAVPLLERFGCAVSSIYCEPDGSFPNHFPDPTVPDNLAEIIALVKEKKADFGVAYDGDADRMAVVDDSGRTLTPEEASYIILSELLKTRKGPIIANVECSRVIDKIAEKFKSKVVRVPVGHTFLMQAVHKERAVFGVEKSGHYTLPFLFPFDDALAISYYAACVISRREGKLSKLMEEIPKFPFGRFSYACPDSKKFQVIENIKKKLSAEYKNVNTMDGVRIDLKNGWVLFRASNTGPVIRLTVEADTLKDFGSIKVDFMKILETEMKKFGLGLAEEKK